MKITSTLLFMSFLTVNCYALEPISNEEMSEEVGQATGIIASLDFRLNADKTGTPLSLCTAASTRTECRLAISLANRGTEASNNRNWLVLKGISGRIYVPKMTLDAASVNYGTGNVAAMEFTFGGTTNKVQFNNIVIDNIGVELDNATSPGYMKDTGTSSGGTNTTAAYASANANSGFAGLQISGPSSTANVAINGTLKVFACPTTHPSCS